MGNIGLTMRALVLSDSDITDLISTRCYPLAFPANATMPCIVYRTVGAMYAPLSAPTPGTPEMASRLQWDVWAETYAEAQTIFGHLVDLFNRYDGTVSGQVLIDTKIDLVFDVYENETKLYRVTVDTAVNHVGA